MIRDKRITTWVLAISVVLIWGTIIFKAFRRDSDAKVSAGTMIVHSGKSAKEKFVYKLLLDYPDPFLGANDEHLKKNQNGAVARKAIPVNWPNLKYNGCVSNKEVVRVHITYNESSLIVKPGEVFAQNCVVKTVNPDSVLIVKENEKKWYKKQL